MNPIRKFLFKLLTFEVARTEINPGDVVVLRLMDETCSAEQMDILLSNFKNIFPNNSCVVLNNGGSLEIMQDNSMEGQKNV